MKINYILYTDLSFSISAVINNNNNINNNIATLKQKTQQFWTVNIRFQE